MSKETSFATFGDYLRHLRRNRMLREVSADCGMGTGALANLENGHRGEGIRVSTIPALARGYGVTVEEMMRWALHFFAGQERP